MSGAVLLILVACVCITAAHYHSDASAKKIITGVEVGLGLSGGLVKRQSGRQSLRIRAIYHSSITTALPPEKSNMLMMETMPKVIEFFENSLCVDQVQAPLLFNQECTEGSFFPNTNLGVQGCGTTCTPTTTCGEISIPEDHLRQCIQCNGNSQSCEAVGSDGVGISNADVVLYVSAIDTRCPSSTDSGSAQTVAFATTCQMEATLDRPIAGNINFCPLGVTGNAADFVLELTKHETAHALGFSSSLFAFWRDENGNPRTPRDPQSRIPTTPFISGYYVPSEDTIRFNVTYNDWRTIDGNIIHLVTHMVTPAVLREARDHFNCPGLAGVELENQGGPGTALSHWEKRILGNEAMTGELSFNPVFSRISLAAFEDSGWYDVNYNMAQDLLWGRGTGCGFATDSCLEWIMTRSSQGLPDTPFCTVANERGCTADYGAVGQCNLGAENPPLDYRYFTRRSQGGGVTIADFCPFQAPFNVRQSDGSVKGTDCSVSDNQPLNNPVVESYGPNSRCIMHGTRAWTNSRFLSFTTGAGCYQYSCSPTTGVTFVVANLAYQCSCEGEEIRFSFSDNGASVTGSFICPACSQMCYDNLARCPAAEPATCYGRVTNIQGSTDLPPTMAPSGPGSGNGAKSNIAVVLFLIVAGLIAIVM